MGSQSLKASLLRRVTGCHLCGWCFSKEAVELWGAEPWLPIHFKQTTVSKLLTSGYCWPRLLTQITRRWKYLHPITKLWKLLNCSTTNTAAAIQCGTDSSNEQFQKLWFGFAFCKDTGMLICEEWITRGTFSAIFVAVKIEQRLAVVQISRSNTNTLGRDTCGWVASRESC